MEILSLLTSPSSSCLSLLWNFNSKQLFRITSHQNHDFFTRNSASKINCHRDEKKDAKRNNINVNFTSLVRTLGKEKMTHIAHLLVHQIKSEGSVPSCDTLLALMLFYADNGLIFHAQAVWDEIINSSYVPSIEVVSALMDAYGNLGRFDEVKRILRDVAFRNFNICPKVYSLAIDCFGKHGQLDVMETVMEEMVSRGFTVDSTTGNAFIIYYSKFGSLTDMEAAYGRFKRSRILIERAGIRAMASRYIEERKFYKMGEFLNDVGLGRRNLGNLLWNLLLLSYAANFKMRSLQREFLRMLEAKFSPDLTTFNIRALAFSRMSLFWDLHLSLEHMKHEKVVPDLVTYGCVVDAFLDKKLGKNLDFALAKLNLDASPFVSTDPLVFVVFGKGDFHSSSELLLEANRHGRWTYRKLIARYLKKKYRSNQIFWNY